MKILFTGASSFTGMWFVKELSAAGHAVTAPLLRPLEKYEGVRKNRLQQIAAHARLVSSCPFGSEPFLTLVKSARWDLFCHHAADVTDYKSPDFDYQKALANNTLHLPAVLDAFIQHGCDRVLLTGSVFEAGEGRGSDELRAVSAYGLSKGLTAEVFKFECAKRDLSLGKFVIPNPFGPYEEDRFTSFLARSWIERKVAPVMFPEYIRDNIHVTLLAKAYRHFAVALQPSQGFSKLNPSQYVEPLGDFAKRFSKELGTRLGISCAYKLHDHDTFIEPKVRINTDPLDATVLNWNEQNAWDELAAYYRETMTHG